jgi:hypothetical protein
VSDTGWPVQHFSQANPEGEGQESVTALLRRVADTLDELDSGVTVQDIVFHSELDDDARWRPTMTVYFTRE